MCWTPDSESCKISLSSSSGDNVYGERIKESIDCLKERLFEVEEDDRKIVKYLSSTKQVVRPSLLQNIYLEGLNCANSNAYISMFWKASRAYNNV